MCRMFLLTSENIQKPYNWLVPMDNSLLAQSINDSSNRPNADGWGIAYLSEANSFNVIKAPNPAFIDSMFKNIVNDVSSKIVVSHVRRGSIGKNLIQNTHPFAFDDWVFTHNGNIPSIKLKKDSLNHFINPEYLGKLTGDTDSELFFYICLSRLTDIISDSDDVIVHRLASTLDKLINLQRFDLKHTALNFFLIKQNIQIGYRFNRPLWYYQDKDKILVASEPINNYNEWRDVPEDNLFIIRNNRIRFYSVQDYAKVPELVI